MRKRVNSGVQGHGVQTGLHQRRASNHVRCLKHHTPIWRKPCFCCNHNVHHPSGLFFVFCARCRTTLAAQTLTAAGCRGCGAPQLQDEGGGCDQRLLLYRNVSSMRCDIWYSVTSTVQAESDCCESVTICNRGKHKGWQCGTCGTHARDLAAPLGVRCRLKRKTDHARSKLLALARSNELGCRHRLCFRRLCILGTSIAAPVIYWPRSCSFTTALRLLLAL